MINYIGQYLISKNKLGGLASTIYIIYYIEDGFARLTKLYSDESDNQISRTLEYLEQYYVEYEKLPIIKNEEIV